MAPLNAIVLTVFAGLGFQSVGTPVVELSAARRFLVIVCPLLVKVRQLPATYIRPLLTATANTSPFVLGSQDVTMPSDTLTAARRFRVVVPLIAFAPKNCPPKYTLPSWTAIAFTLPFTFGSQFVATPVVPSTAARRLREVFPLIEFAPL